MLEGTVRFSGLIQVGGSTGGSTRRSEAWRFGALVWEPKMMLLAIIVSVASLLLLLRVLWRSAVPTCSDVFRRVSGDALWERL